MATSFKTFAGDTKVVQITVLDADGDPVDITSATIKWQAARSLGKSPVITKATGGSGVSITDAANGVFEVTLSGSDTEDLKGDYYFEAEVTASDGTISTVIAGTMKVTPVLIAAT